MITAPRASNGDGELVNVEVCYVGAAGPVRVALSIPDDASLAEAVAQSDIVRRCGLDGADLIYAVFGRRATGVTRLHDGDRVELLRPLLVDPKEARRRRVAKKERMPGSTTS